MSPLRDNQLALTRVANLYRQLWLVLLLLSASPAFAGQGDAQDPQAMLQKMADELIAEVRRDPAQVQDINRVRALAERYILPHVDFQAAAQWVLGKYWRTASDVQRRRFTEEFRRLLLNTYLRSISSYHEYQYRLLPLRSPPQSDRVEVDGEVQQSSGPVIHINFRLRRAGAIWLIYDISIDGISLVATHRSTYAREISAHGIDSLIDRLARQNASGSTEPEQVGN